MRSLLVTILLVGCSGDPRPTPPMARATTDAAAPPAEDAPAASARAFVEHLAAGRYDAAVTQLDATMTAAMPVDKLAQTWAAVEAQAGAFQAIEAVRVERGRHPAAFVTCRHERTRLDVQVTFAPDGKVAGLFFHAAYEAPAYVDRARFAERELVIGSGPWQLPATLALPHGTGPFRAVVLVHGSGPHDRDETIGPNRPFKDLAGGLASRGIAVLRYDKRTKVHAARLAKLPDMTVDDEVVDDAVAAVDALRAQPTIDAAHIVVAGHSLGGQLAPRIATRSKHVAAIAILAGSTRPLVDAMLDQLAHIAAVDPRQAPAIPALVAETRRAGERIRQLQAGATPRPGEVLLGAGAAYWIDFGRYDAAAVAASLRRPIFVAQGGRDYQVTDVDYAAWRSALAGRRDVTFAHYPELDHLLAPGTGPSSPQHYQTRTPVDVRLIDDLAAWVRGL